MTDRDNYHAVLEERLRMYEHFAKLIDDDATYEQLKWWAAEGVRRMKGLMPPP